MQRNQIDAPALVEIRILLFESGPKCVHLALCLIQAHSWLQHSNRAQKPARAYPRPLREDERQPKLRRLLYEGIFFDEKVKALRHNANDRVCLTVERERFAHDIKIAAEMFLPKTVSQHGDVVFALYSILWRERAAEHRVTS